jgi:XTP/dITP diphosphohydrolase
MFDSIKKPIIFFATSNPNKYNEIKGIFKQESLGKLKLLQTQLVEIQSSDLEEIAVFSLEYCATMAGKNPIFVEDSGLFIKELNGFPGPYSAYVLEKLGLKGILSLMRKVKDREAYFQSTIALKIENRFEIFTERVKGRISKVISGKGWGYDPIFIPESNGSRTYGELGSRKNKISHRFLATIRLIKFLKEEFPLVD